MTATVNLSVCIATFKRLDRLALVLGDLKNQQRLPDEVIVVDNDVGGSARTVIDQFVSGSPPFKVHYDIQPARNIALTRNKTVELSSGEWLAFIDDDERAPPEWLLGLMSAAAEYRADGVLSPVEPVVPESAPAWIRRGRFYDFPHMASGEIVPLNRMRFGNLVLRGALLRKLPGPFDPVYGLTCGEDGDLLIRMVESGCRIVWYEAAIVYEPVETSRLSLRWLMQRSLSGGQAFARNAAAGRYGSTNGTRRIELFVQALVQMLVAGGLAFLTWPLGRHHSAHWLIKASANFGKLSIFWGWRYREYA